MADVVRQIVLKARMDASRSSLSKAFIDPATEAAKIRKNSQRDEERYQVRLAAMKDREAIKTAAFADKNRRAEEAHVAKMEQRRLATIKKEAAERAKQGAFQGEGSAKDVLKSALGDKGAALAIGTAMGIGFMSTAGPAMKTLASEIAGTGGPFSDMSREFWAGGAALIKELAKLAGADNRTSSRLSREVTDNGWRVGLAGLLAGSAGGGMPGLAMLPGLFALLKQDRGVGYREPGTKRPGEFGGVGAKDRDPKVIMAMQEQVAEKNLQLLDNERDRMVKLADARKALVKVEEEAIEKSKRLIETEKQKLQSAKEEFGMLSGRERDTYKSIADKIGKGGLNSLNTEELDFARNHKGFASLFAEQARKNADAGGFSKVVEALGADKTLKNAEAEIKKNEQSKAGKEAGFDKENKLTFTNNQNVEITIDPTKQAEELARKIAPMLADANARAEKKLKDEIAKLEGRIQGGQPQIGL